MNALVGLILFNNKLYFMFKSCPTILQQIKFSVSVLRRLQGRVSLSTAAPLRERRGRGEGELLHERPLERG